MLVFEFPLAVEASYDEEVVVEVIEHNYWHQLLSVY